MNCFPSIFIKILTALFLAFLSISASANQPLAETETLKRALAELNTLGTLIDESRRRADRQGRYRFEYNELMSDIYLVKHGLRSAIFGTRNQTRQVKALSGDYGEVGVVGEAEILQMLIQELQAISPLLQDAKFETNQMIRLKVNYEALQGDLNTIISGIQHALSGSGEHPRKTPALRGGFSHG